MEVKALPQNDKWTLWQGGTRLRGANIWQKRVRPQVDGTAFGSGKMGPPYTQAEFDALKNLGANWVNFSVPGIYTEKPPYQLEEALAKELDALLDKVRRADLFAVLSFRTGPGRNEDGFDSTSQATAVHTVWKDKTAQEHGKLCGAIRLSATSRCPTLPRTT